MKLDHNKYIGTTLAGGYRIQRFLGKGAFAWVYLAFTSQGEPVAVKVQYNLADDSHKRFLREIKVLKELPRNSHCVGYIGSGETVDRLPFLAMEYVDGRNLKQILKKSRIWNEEKACRFMSQLCDAFAGLHQLGLVHRDVKPENIMVTTDGRVKLMDFGLVKDAQGLLRLIEEEDILENRAFAENIDRGVLAGTPEYMAPEQFSDPSISDETKIQTDTWTDVYSLGLIFYELLTGEKLFPFTITEPGRKGHARALLAYLKERTTFEEHRLRSPKGLSRELWTIINRALRQGPKLRQRNAAELGQQIDNFIRTGEGIFVEDEDKTSAINIDAFFARYQTETSEQESDYDGEHTVPLNRNQLFAITNEIEKARAAAKNSGGIEVDKTQRWSREEAAVAIGGHFFEDFAAQNKAPNSAPAPKNKHLRSKQPFDQKTVILIIAAVIVVLLILIIILIAT